MNSKKIIQEEYTDEKTGMKIYVDDRGNYHCFMGGLPEIKVIVETNPDWEKERKRLVNIMESLRRENNWLWGVIEKALDDDRKHSAGYAIRQLQKKIKERQR